MIIPTGEDRRSRPVPALLRVFNQPVNHIMDMRVMLDIPTVFAEHTTYQFRMLYTT